MDNNTQKTLTFLEKNKEIRKQLFAIKKDEQFVHAFLINKHFDTYSQNVQWLFKALFDEHLILGFNDTHQVIGLNQRSESLIICDRLENLPYEVIRQELKTFKNTQTYFENYPNRKVLLQTYEKWAYQEKILLDFRHVYHFENGEMFSTYFE